MNSSWKQYLTNYGAHVENDLVSDFGNISAELEATQDSTVLCDLSQFGMIQIKGEDAQSFLHSQLSNNVTRLAINASQYTAYCSPKGRMLAGGLLICLDAKYWMQLSVTTIASITKRLAMFILRAKVRLSDVSDTLTIFGLSGPDAKTILEREIGVAPNATHQIVKQAELHVLGLAADRYQIIAPMQQAADWWVRLARHAKPVGSPCWDWLLVRSGIVTITQATQDQFVPQMVNYEIIGGVNFDKGCYPGQEIVARTKYLGKLNRRMYLAHLDSNLSPQAGDELFTLNTGDQACGSVVNVAPAPIGGFDLLACVFIASLQNQSLHWKSLEGPKLNLLSLPYSFD